MEFTEKSRGLPEENHVNLPSSAWAPLRKSVGQPGVGLRIPWATENHVGPREYVGPTEIVGPRGALDLPKYAWAKENPVGPREESVATENRGLPENHRYPPPRERIRPRKSRVGCGGGAPAGGPRGESFTRKIAWAPRRGIPVGPAGIRGPPPKSDEPPR